MCSSNGAGRVLDLYKINGYVRDGSNLQIYNATDPLAQHWYIVGLGGTKFKLVPRTDMSLALTAYGDETGTAEGRSTTSAGNIFVSTFVADNDYQIWKIIDETGDVKTNTRQTIHKHADA